MPGEYKIQKFILEIKKINPYLEFIFFMKKENEELKEFLISNGINKIYIDGESSIEEIINGICYVENQNNLTLEIERLKKIIVERTETNENNSKNEEIKNKKLFKTSKAIGITGYYGSGKTLFTAMLAKAADKINLKTIIIDFDILNNSINNLFNISKYNKNYKNSQDIEHYIIKINNNISIFAGLESLFNENNKINFEKIQNLLEKLKEKYNLILFDTSSETNLKYVKTALANVQKIIFLIEPNLIELKKAKELLEIYIEDWEIPKHKFNIVLNKVNINSIENEIIDNLFNNIQIIGKIKLSKNYTCFANNVTSNIISLKEYEKILQKIG